MNIPLPASGKYQIEIRSQPGEAKPSIYDMAGGKILPLVEPNADDSLKVLIDAKSESSKLKINYLKGKELSLNWIRITPIFTPIESVSVSNVSDNPGPFPGKNFNETLPIEKSILQDAEEHSSIDASWKKIIPGADGTIDLAEATGKKSGIVYLSWRINAPATRNILLGLGVDYGSRLWLNGKVIFDSTKVGREGPPKPNEFLVPVSLNQGTNSFLAKVTSGSNAWTVQLNSNMQ